MAEPESTALRRIFSATDEPVTSALGLVEVPRAIRRSDPTRVPHAVELLESVRLIGLDAGLLDAAARLEPAHLSSLDAIHLASALALGSDLDTFLTYDARLADAVRAVGIRVASPT